MNTEPWIEKYRPNNFNEIILTDTTRSLLNNMIDNNEINNSIFYGPPGTGKTTTILCLLKEYSNKYNCKNNSIHLNASHERGVDVVRNQIYEFTQTKNFFNNQRKFVILDEVDSMTKQAQSILYQLIKNCENVTFFLICNYLNKIIEPIRCSLFLINFYNTSIHSKDYINNIIKKEKIKIKKEQIDELIRIYHHDLRSIINSLQSFDKNMKIIDNKILKIICLEDTKKCKKQIDILLKSYDIYNILDRIMEFMNETFVLDYEIINNMKQIIINTNINNERKIEYFLNIVHPKLQHLSLI